MPAKRELLIFEDDLKFYVRFFDEDWEEVPGTEATCDGPMDVMRVLRSWRKRILEKIGEPAEKCVGYQRAYLVTVEILYGPEEKA